MDCFGHFGRDLHPLVLVNVQQGIMNASCGLGSECVN